MNKSKWPFNGGLEKEAVKDQDAWPFGTKEELLKKEFLTEAEIKELAETGWIKDNTGI